MTANADTKDFLAKRAAEKRVNCISCGTTDEDCTAMVLSSRGNPCCSLCRSVDTHPPRDTSLSLYEVAEAAYMATGAACGTRAIAAAVDAIVPRITAAVAESIEEGRDHFIRTTRSRPDGDRPLSLGDEMFMRVYDDAARIARDWKEGASK